MNPPGTVITVAPAVGDPGQLLAVVQDCARVGAARVRLGAGQPERGAVAAVLVRELGLLVVEKPDPAVDLAAPDLDGPELVAAVAGLIGVARGPVSLRSRGPRTLPVLLAALASGGHLWLDDPDPADGPVGPGIADLPGLTARASGLARIVGRPPVPPATVRAVLGLPENGDHD